MSALRRLMAFIAFAIVAVMGGLTLSLSASAAPDPFEQAVESFDSSDYATAYRLLLPLAENGLAKAQVTLGIMYASGYGVPRNDAAAVKWFRRAADQGDAFAQHNLGVMHDEGRGIAQDRAKAAEWFEKAANHGLADAQYDLGRAYAEGLGVRQDYVVAYKWLSLAAAQGDQRAAHNRRIISRRMSPQEIQHAQSLTREWTPTITRPTDPLQSR